MPQPVIAFLRHSLTLKAAIADCLEEPKPKPSTGSAPPPAASRPHSNS